MILGNIASVATLILFVFYFIGRIIPLGQIVRENLIAAAVV